MAVTTVKFETSLKITYLLFLDSYVGQDADWDSRTSVTPLIEHSKRTDPVVVSELAVAAVDFGNCTHCTNHHTLMNHAKPLPPYKTTKTAEQAWYRHNNSTHESSPK